ncbi:glycoside hydrolase family 36 protein [Schleiferilactobacillus shenzhenensis]|uniref:Alpha-galactosidase n=1 Tax=Schleiferilactobacillus shenzhenensis LY-73 TaxID=1231336 RepID=U4TJQ9_9LACO|nr:glycoside hydrolase family 36 protein [Schleiferilactobacillus shenzhenensis]ERL65071.1 alpha-galactosidase [Schleiferilactobacillus shenzhenensis LY-73]
MLHFTDLARYQLGDMVAHYLVDEDHHVELMIYPVEDAPLVSVPRHQKTVCSLIQARVAGTAADKNFTNGLTMYNNATVQSLKLIRHTKRVREDDDAVIIRTSMRDGHGNLYAHHLLWRPGEQRLHTWTTVQCNHDQGQRFLWLASFCLSGISPFYSDAIPAGTLDLLRLRSKWAMEGRLEERPVEDYDLESSWKPSGLALEQFGQNGTMPVRRFFPWVGLRDKHRDVTWLAELAVRASWQLNVGRLDDRLMIFGGLPDADNGQWYVDLERNEKYQTPVAYLTVAHGDLARVSHRLQPAVHNTDLPIIYNEWGTTWGNPSATLIHESLTLLQQHAIGTYVIDAGWYQSALNQWDGGHGDWVVDPKRFPEGLAPVVQDIHQHNMKAGLWFEFETAGRHSLLGNDHDAEPPKRLYLFPMAGFSAPHAEAEWEKEKAEKTMLLREHDRDGVHRPVSTVKRRFLDLTQPIVRRYLQIRMIDLLKTAGFDYLKVDYNDSLGLDVQDVAGAASPAESLQRLTAATMTILKEVRKQIPNIKIENCASGGHRLTPAWINATDLSSFSDAHETTSIPIIAANELNVVPAAKNLIWCVVHPDDGADALYYHLIATFLGRVCLSGDIRQLSAPQWQIIDECLTFYRAHSDLIAQGRPFRSGPDILSYHDPVGYQVSGFRLPDEVLYLFFGFNLPEAQTVAMNVPPAWHQSGTVGSPDITLAPGQVTIPAGRFVARAVAFQR